MKMDLDHELKRRNGYGKAIAAQFQELGYHGELHPDMFEWLFGLPSMRIQAFLEWFQQAIRTRHSVACALEPTDYAMFQQLLHNQHGGFLHGDALDREELTYIHEKTMKQDESLDMIRMQNDQLTVEIHQLEQQLARMEQKNDRLSHLVQRTMEESDQQAQAMQQEADQDVFPDVLSDLKARSRPQESKCTTFEELVELTASIDDQLQALQGTTEEFVFQHPSFDHLRDQELHHLQQTRALMASFASIPTANEEKKDAKSKTMAMWLHESDASTLELHQRQDIDMYNQCSIELARLEKAFGLAERDLVHAELQATAYDTHWDVLNHHVKLLEQQYQLMNAETLEIKRQTLETTIRNGKQQVEVLVQQLIPNVMEEMAFLKTTMILLGNYEQKLWRQEHRFLQLRAILERVERQHARIKLVHGLLVAEHEDLEALEATCQELAIAMVQAQDALHQRLRLYEEQEHTTISCLASGRTTIHDLDAIAQSLFTSLTTTDDQKLRRWDDLERLCRQKHENAASLADSRLQVAREWRKLFEQKQDDFRSLRTLLFGDASSLMTSLLPFDVLQKIQQTQQKRQTVDYEMQQSMDRLRLLERSLAMDPSIRQTQETKRHELQASMASSLLAPSVKRLC